MNEVTREKKIQESHPEGVRPVPSAAPKDAAAQFKPESRGIVNLVKKKVQEISPGARKKVYNYEETLLTKTAYAANRILTFSGKITRSLMESYKRVFDFPEEESANIYSDLGLNFLEKADYKQAIASFRKSLELHPENKDVFYFLGNAYLKLENYLEAVSSFISAVKHEKDNPTVHFELGLSYAGLEKYDEAISSYETAVELDPENDEVYYWLGVACDQVKDYKSALVYFKKAIDLDPRESRYYHSLGFTYECMKQHDQAIECFKKAIEMERK